MHFLEESKKKRPPLETAIEVKICDVLWKSGKHDKAIEKLLTLLKANPSSQDVLNQLEIFAGDYYEKMNDVDKAKKSL